MSSKKPFAVYWGPLLLAVAPLLLGTFACNRIESKAPEGNQDPVEIEPTPEKLEATSESIQRKLIAVSCLKCHSQAVAGNRHVALADITQVIERTGHTHDHGKMRYLIKPGCPKQSFFLSIIREGKMPPPPAEKVSGETLKVIEEWIISLKPNAGKTCESDEPPDDRSVGGDESDGDEPG